MSSDSHCRRTRISGSEAEDSRESRRGFISAMNFGFAEAAEDTRRRIDTDDGGAAEAMLEEVNIGRALNKSFGS